MWHNKDIETIAQELNTDISKGLTQKEATKRLSQYGLNLFPAKKKPPLIFKFFAQFQNALVTILLIAASISFFLGDTLDTLAIFSIVILNASLGFLQEIQAEKTLESLKEKEIQFSFVLRNGVVEKVPTKEIVPGDILVLEEGEKVAADARIIESFSLQVDESILTGESLPVSKNIQTFSPSLPLADRKNMIYKDTKIVSGRGKAIVVATGKETEMGKIALFLKEAKEEKTPLTLELEKVVKTLTIVIISIAGIIFFLNFAKGIPFIESFLVSISLAVAAIPEGMPAVVTIVLSLGVKRLAEKKTLVKKLPAVETLGAVKIIATDKTGTLTQNKINVVKIILADKSEFSIDGIGYQKEGVFFDSMKKIINPQQYPKLELFLKAAVLASNATISPSQEILGDTTEGALLVAAERGGLKIEEIRQAEPKIYEIPFSSERKMASILVKVNETQDHFLYSKGAPEVIFPRTLLSQKEKQDWLNLTKFLASHGLRTLAVARKKLSIHEVKSALEENKLKENNLEFLGIAAMQDPLRPEIFEALSKAKEAGIRTIMITGDHKETATAIALEAGIIEDNQKTLQVLTEKEVQSLTKKELAKKIKEGVSVFARISPMGKLKIIEAIKSLPHMQVAVTGDGVNDAPALTASHIGISMGQTGTDLTREVAHLIITDDNYATIVDAIKEGRVIFANLVKFIRYLISCNLSEVIVVASGVFFDTPLPLLPIQILWINLITDGFPALALGMDPPEFDVMKKPPRDLSQGILHKKRWLYMFLEGSIMGISTFFLFLYALVHFSYTIAQTMTFTALALSQLIHAFNNRSTRKSLFQLGVFGNKYLLAAALLSFTLQILAVQTNQGNLIFKTHPLSLSQWTMVILTALITFVVVEIKKQLRVRLLP